VDGERAESHLRQIAEAELRHAVTAPPQVYSLTELKAARRPVRFTQVAHALTTVGAIAPGTAYAIQVDYDLAQIARWGSDNLPLAYLGRGPVISRPMARQPRLSQPGRPQAGRVVPVGLMIPVRHDEVRGELHLLAYAHTLSGARFTVTAWLRGPLFARSPHPPSIAAVLDLIVATDDKGASYQSSYNGAGALVEWTGELCLRPEPPRDIRWLDLTMGETTQRVQLDRQVPAPEITVLAAAHSPGERYLDGIAARVLASLPLFPADLRRRHPEFRPVLPEHLTDSLGAIIAALQVAGALSPLSPAPGQLRTLCESAGITAHGISAPARADLPGPWLSLLTQLHRRRADPAPPTPGCAGVAVALPELDGIRLSILGIHNGDDGTVIHLHAAGLTADGLPASDALPLLWIRDEEGRWHATRRNISAGRGSDGELSIRLEVVPPLNRGSWIEVLATGRTAEVRVILPLHWR